MSVQFRYNVKFLIYFILITQFIHRSAYHQECIYIAMFSSYHWVHLLREHGHCISSLSASISLLRLGYTEFPLLGVSCRRFDDGVVISARTESSCFGVSPVIVDLWFDISISSLFLPGFTFSLLAYEVLYQFVILFFPKVDC